MNSKILIAALAVAVAAGCGGGTPGAANAQGGNKVASADSQTPAATPTEPGTAPDTSGPTTSGKNGSQGQAPSAPDGTSAPGAANPAAPPATDGARAPGAPNGQAPRAGAPSGQRPNAASPPGGSGGNRERGNMGGGGMRGGMGAVGLLAREDVRKELGVTEAQQKKIQDGMASLRPKEGERPDMNQMMEKGKKLIASVLSASQTKRLEELEVQRFGPSLLTRPDVAAKVGLSADQSAKIKAMIDDSNKKQQEMFQNAKPEDRQKLGDQVRANRKALEDKILETLTASQKAKWTALQGKPFTFAQGGGGAPRAGNFSTPRT